MARGKKGVDNLNETLSTEKPEVQNELLKDLINENNNEENQDNPGSNENNELNKLSNEPAEENVEKTVNTDFKSGDRVKVNKNTNTGIMGRRIHAGLKNYTYKIRSVRPDGVACIECLTHVFNVKLADLEKVN